MKKNKATNIRLLRESKGFSQEYIANQLGVSQQAYSRMEQSPDRITLKRLYNLSHILQVKLVELIGEESTLVLQNFNQQGGQAGTQFNINGQSLTPEKELYERLIAELREEVLFLRGLLKK